MQQEISYVQLSILKLVKKSIQFMGENLVNHCLLRYTEHSIIKYLWSLNYYNYNSVQKVQQIPNPQKFNYVRKSHKPSFIEIYWISQHQIYSTNQQFLLPTQILIQIKLKWNARCFATTVTKIKRLSMLCAKEIESPSQNRQNL